MAMQTDWKLTPLLQYVTIKPPGSIALSHHQPTQNGDQRSAAYPVNETTENAEDAVAQQSPQSEVNVDLNAQQSLQSGVNSVQQLPQSETHQTSTGSEQSSQTHSESQLIEQTTTSSQSSSTSRSVEKPSDSTTPSGNNFLEA